MPHVAQSRLLRADRNIPDLLQVVNVVRDDGCGLLEQLQNVLSLACMACDMAAQGYHSVGLGLLAY